MSRSIIAICSRKAAGKQAEGEAKVDGQEDVYHSATPRQRRHARRKATRRLLPQ